ncbi:MAG: CRISPR-associated helicase Cas3' [Polyangiaceae bacterium]
MKYTKFFEQIAGFPPYPYQARLGEGAWPDILDIPTGLGKTASVVIAWMWRVLNDDANTGRRLVYCLPMRTLVEQTTNAASAWCERAQGQFADKQRPTPLVHAMLGGSVDEAWELHPELPAILVGTQDMLLSRALNRGYGMSRFKWPVHFGLLNNDAIWIFDETQLMGVGVETSAQLAAFREKLGNFGGTRSVWMSATLGQGQLATVDHPSPKEGWRLARLDDADAQFPAVTQRTGAKKRIERLSDLVLNKSTKDRLNKSLAETTLTLHAQRGGLTLVIVNRVERAQALYRAVAAAASVPVHLVHSRFRPAERARLNQAITTENDRIVIATQALEAGVDISARTLISELAPWPSMVQRFGRCNRYGEQKDARILWLDIEPENAKDDVRLPYELEDLDMARRLLEQLGGQGDGGQGDAGPSSLRSLDYEPPDVIRPVLRRKDLLDLFDTTPDVLGNDLDVSRYVRDGEDLDVLIYWRAFDDKPDAPEMRPRRDELCRVSLSQAKRFVEGLKKQRQALKKPKPQGKTKKTKAKPNTLTQQQLTPWCFDTRLGDWEECTSVRPGQTLLLHSAAGGYSVELGWTGEPGATPPLEPAEAVRSEEALDADDRSRIGIWVTLRRHLGHVRSEAELFSTSLPLPQDIRAAVVTAAEWHDVGKAHKTFQEILGVSEDPDATDPPYAKSKRDRRDRSVVRDNERPYFRHELASALAWLQSTDEATDCRDLIAFLVAAHHGKVRLSIRSVPGEKVPNTESLFARGVWDGDELPSVDLPVSGQVSQLRLDLTPILLGKGSWVDRVSRLRDSEALGPFRMAYLEAIVRVADWTASSKEQLGEYND